MNSRVLQRSFQHSPKMLWLLTVLFFLAGANASAVRVCVPSHLAASCAQMSQDLPESFVCVNSPDTFSCIEKVANSEADLTAVDPNGLFLAGKYFNLKPIITELVDGEPYRYQGIALVAKDDPSIQSAADLKGKKSCHTGFWRTVGWQIPISKLLAKNVMEPSCEEGELGAASNFFKGSCLAGNWSKDPVVNRLLKEKYPKLCSQCKDPETCSDDDPHYGYEGVIKCLTDGFGDVAFTKIPVLREVLAKDPSLTEKAELLCFEGGRKSLDDPEPCTWGVRPTNAYVARANDEEDVERLATVMLETQTRYSVPKVSIPSWYYETFLTHPKVSGIKRTAESRRSYIDYLGEFLHTIRKPRHGCTDEEKHDVNFCVTSTEEELKCQDFSKAADARGFWPQVRCVKAASKAACMETVKEGHAHLVVLDGGDIYKAGRYYDLEPLAGEQYGDLDVTYYAVAVQRSVSDVSKLSDLRGLRSCHTGMGRTAGWVMPIGALLTEGVLEANGSCNHAEAVAKFFSGGSCVPGANDTKYNPGRIRSDDLCRRCIGDEEGLHRCARDSQERYSGYGGAFRCLAEGKGDVAFVRHSTASEYTDGRSTLHWAKDLLSSDFHLLCGEEGTADISEYKNCNLGKVPSHHVLTGREVPAERRLQLANVLADSSRYFNSDSSLFKLFHKRYYSDLLFKDSTTGLLIVPFSKSYEKVLGDRFLQASRASDPKNCE